MGTDNLFHKRKAKNPKALRRRIERRDIYAKILIVCEGEKTEPNYFKGAREHYKLNTAEVEICGDCGSDPMSIVRYAKQRYREEKDTGDAFDKVFCVFDKDTHASYVEALHALESVTPRATFYAITSVPCFEYWLLLHFDYTTKPYTALPGDSAGSQMLAELKKYMPEYQKGQQFVFLTLIEQLEFAISNATRALQAATANGTDNPSTRVHELVDFMQNIKKA